MTVAQLRARMSHPEWISWTVYYGRQAQREELARKMVG